jgi:hypothetical protein
MAYFYAIYNNPTRKSRDYKISWRAVIILVIVITIYIVSRL